MPLHVWRKGMDWFTVHQGWAFEVVGYLKPRLPPGYRAQLGPIPKPAGFALGVPDAHVRDMVATPPEGGDAPAFAGAAQGWGEPDAELLVVDLETDSAVFVSRDGQLVTAIELISPENKDSPEERDQTAARYANYLQGGANLVLVDVHPQPDRPTVPDRLGERFKLGRGPLPAPFAIVYGVGRAGRPGGGWPCGRSRWRRGRPCRRFRSRCPKRRPSRWTSTSPTRRRPITPISTKRPATGSASSVPCRVQ